MPLLFLYKILCKKHT